jgi:hypothetical protein
MRLTRRSFLNASALAPIAVSDAFGQAGARLPNPANFESGDFLWPKKPGAFIPYQYQTTSNVDADRERWNREKADFINRARAGAVPDGERVAAQLQTMTYNDFRSLYLRNLPPNAIVPYSSGIAAVGHVAIVELDTTNVPWIIEALWELGVVRQRYSSWIASRASEIVWHGRLRNYNAADRAKISTVAQEFVSRPYDFWNFNLADSTGFYCSKLVWLSVMQALNVAVDGDTNSARRTWLSPKQILYGPAIKRLFDPGEYATE